MQYLSTLVRTGGALGLALSLGAAAACADRSAGPDQDAAGGIRLEVISGNSQSALVGTELPQPLVVRALNASGVPIADQIVNFRVTAGGGTVFAGAARTNSSGYAREWWTLGPQPGLNRVEARAVDASTGQRQTFGVFEATGTTTAPAPTPTTIALSPDSASVPAGQTVQLTTVVRDQSGNPMTATVGYTSLAPSIATVSSSGLVTGVSAGTARIVAQSGSLADTSRIVVTSTTTPPPPSGGAGALVFSDDFESGSLSKWTDGVDATRHRILTGAGAHGGTRHLQITYPAGSHGGYMNTFFGPGYDSVHFSYYVRYPSTWTGGSYMFGLYGSRTDNLWSGYGKGGVCPNGTDYTNHFVTFIGSTTEPGPVGFYTYHMDMNGDCWGDQGLRPGAATFYEPRTMARGSWHRVELQVRLNTPGQYDGWQRLYIDGVLKGEWKGLRQRSTTNVKINSLQITANTSGGAVSTTRTMDIDDVTVSQLASTGTGTPAPAPAPAPAPVATVTVAPSSATVAAGGTVQLSATTRDASGNTLTGRSVTWTSSNPGVATVSGTGLVTGVAAGSATITATSEGRSGTSAVSVTAPSSPPPPPPTGTGFGNEPAGMTLVSDYGFDALNGGGWTYQQKNAYARIVSDASAPRGGGVLEFVFPQGFTAGGYAPAAERVSGIGTGRREIYWAFYWKANPGWQNHASNVNKLLYGWINSNTTFGMSWYWSRATKPNGQVVAKHLSIFEGGRYYLPNTNEAFDIQDDQWYKVEIHLRLSSAPGVADGAVRVWVNDVLQSNYPSATITSGRITEAYFEPTWGGAGGTTKLREDYFRFDHARMSVR